jgi:hypothetical protein
MKGRVNVQMMGKWADQGSRKRSKKKDNEDVSKRL